MLIVKNKHKYMTIYYKNRTKYLTNIYKCVIFCVILFQSSIPSLPITGNCKNNNNNNGFYSKQLYIYVCFLTISLCLFLLPKQSYIHVQIFQTTVINFINSILIVCCRQYCQKFCVSSRKICYFFNCMLFCYL